MLTFWGRDECPDEEEEDEDAEDDAEPLDQVHVGDLNSFRRSHAEYHRYPAEENITDITAIIGEETASEYNRFMTWYVPPPLSSSYKLDNSPIRAGSPAFGHYGTASCQHYPDSRSLGCGSASL